MFNIGDVLKHKDTGEFETVDSLVGNGWFRSVNNDEIKYSGNYDLVSVKMSDVCFHIWVNVGFHFDKYVCSKCDKEK